MEKLEATERRDAEDLENKARIALAQKQVLSEVSNP